jgi:4-hydroxy-3-polyprenylbenzoate decarboxylase
VKGVSTDLILPAFSEIVLEGECPSGENALEGPFGEWTGYYAGEKKAAPLMHVKSILHRNDPIVLGCSPASRGDFYEVTYWACLFRSATLKKSIEEAGVSGVKGVWPHEFGGGRQFLAVSIKQEFSGHARQAGFVASQCREGAYAGRYVVVVDDDIDPTDIKEVLWAMCTRVDPVKDIDFIRKAWGSRLDPMKSEDSVPEADTFYNTRAIIDACIPYERRKTFPQRNSYSREVKSKILAKWKDAL